MVDTIDTKFSELSLKKCTGLLAFRTNIDWIAKFNEDINRALTSKYSFLGDLQRDITPTECTFKCQLIKNGTKSPSGYALVCMEIKDNNTDKFNEEINKKLSFSYIPLGELVEFRVGDKLFFQRELVRFT